MNTPEYDSPVHELDHLFREAAIRLKLDEEMAEHHCFIHVIAQHPKRLELHPDVEALARQIDHTYLTITPDNPWKDVTEVMRICKEAAVYGFASVCIRLNHVKIARRSLDYWNVSDVAVCTVIDFPKGKGDIAGTASPDDKAAEALQAQRDGATEFDMVLDYEAVLRGDFEHARQGVLAVCDTVKNIDSGAIVKVIMETARLRDQGGWLAIDNACDAVVDGGADFGKTSTGFALEGGATLQDVQHLSETLHPCGVQVKASGGIRDLKTAEAMRQAGPERHGADRLGLSGSVSIIKEKIEEIGKM